MDEETPNTHILFIELATLEFDKPFDGLVAGEFTDMHGRSVKITPDDLSEIVANTNALIESTRSESGELAGLPIDEMQHNKGHASGWLMGVELAGNVLRIIPQWTELGRELISKKIQRYFSATVDLAKKVIYGGTLTNWPATRDNKTGRVLLRPIELSQLYEIQAETEETHPPQSTKENKDMSENKEVVDLAELRAQMKAELLAELAPKKGDETAEAAVSRLKEELNLSAFADVADLGKAREAMLSQMQAALKAEYERMQASSGRMLAEMMAQIKREQHIAEFAQYVTGGNEKTPRGLPVGREEVETFLSELNDKQRAAAESILKRTIETGFVEFSELGHGKDGKRHGTEKLDEPLARLLREHLKNGGELAAWFDLAGVGEMTQYDLRDFEKEK